MIHAEMNPIQFRDLNESQILALAITAEEEDAHIYRDFADWLKADFPTDAELFMRMAGEEDGHRQRLVDAYHQRFGGHVPLIRRQEVKGFYVRRSSWLTRTLQPERARKEAAMMEIEARRFYQSAALRAKDPALGAILEELAGEEQRHESLVESITAEQAASGDLGRQRESARRFFVLRFVQPGLAGLMDGSVSTLAPLFAAAFATFSTSATFRVGLAASVGFGCMVPPGPGGGTGLSWASQEPCQAARFA